LHEEVGLRKLDYDGRKEVSIVMTPTQSVTQTTRIAHPTTTSAAQPSKDQPLGEGKEVTDGNEMKNTALLAKTKMTES